MRPNDKGVTSTWLRAGWKRPDRLKQQAVMYELNKPTLTEGHSSMTQNQLILDHLKAGHILTQMDALKIAGCFRLAARIFDLRAQGHDIEMVPVQTDTGKYIASYKMKINQPGE